MANGADFYSQNGSTEFKVIGSTGDITAQALYAGSTSHIVVDSSGNILLGSSGKLFTGSTDSTNVAVDSSGQLYYRGYDIANSIQTLTSGAGSSASQITGYGVTIHTGDTGTSLQMAAPAYAGARKTIIFTKGSSIARTIDSTNTTGSTDNDRGWSFYNPGVSTNSSGITLTTGTTGGATLEFIAVTTKQWALLPAGTSTPVYTLATT